MIKCAIIASIRCFHIELQYEQLHIQWTFSEKDFFTLSQPNVHCRCNDRLHFLALSLDYSYLFIDF